MGPLQNNKFSTIFIVFLAIFFIFLSFLQNQKLKSQIIQQQITPIIRIPTPTVSDTTDIPGTDFSKGWYWGSVTQKKSGTPDDWVFIEAGRSSCWHKVGVDCIF